MTKKRKQQGQSLMEAIVAIAILLMVVIAVLALTISGVTGQKNNEQQVVANNLAREGIELVRNLRDSNWVAGRPWYTGFEQNSVGLIDYRSTAVDYSIDASPQLGFDADGFYAHQPFLSGSPYSRTVQIQAICFSQSVERIAAVETNCLSSEQQIGVKVSSTVTWQDDGDIRLVKLEDLLYDWK